MATKVTSAQIISVNPSQINIEGGIEGDVLVARRTSSNGGLTLTWSPTSILPRTALHGQVLTYNFYTSQWTASSINTQATSLPQGNSNQINQVLTWNGTQWVVAPSQGTVTSIGIQNTDGTITVGSPSVVTTVGTINIAVNNIPLSKINQGASLPGQVITWNGTTNTWTPSAATNSIGNIRAILLFDGRVNPVNTGILFAKNITSITDNGVGDYTINFASNTFGDTNYTYSYGISKNIAGQFTSSVVEVGRTSAGIRINTGFTYSSDRFDKFDTNNIGMIFVN